MDEELKKLLQKRLKDFETTRKLPVDRSLINEKTRTVPFILISQENEGERYDWWKDEVYIEKLDVNGAVFSRLKTMFKDHYRSVDSAVARWENIRVEDGQLKADAVFGTDDDSEKIFRKYVDGILTDCSIGYKILTSTIEERKDEPTLVTITSFDIYEASAVGVGFDKGATVGRNEEKFKKEVNSMNEELRSELLALRTSVDALTEEQKTRKADLEKLEKKDKETQTRATADAQRGAEILDLVAAGHITVQRGQELIKTDDSMDQIRKMILDEKRANSAATVKVGGTPDAENMSRAIEDSIISRCGVVLKDAHEDMNMFRGATLTDIAKYVTGTTTMDRTAIAERAMSNDQFSLILGNVANRVLVDKFMEQEATYQLWTNNVELPDFRLRNDVSAKNPNGRLSKLKEKGDLENLELDENGEAWKLESFGNKFFFTRQMIINDDLGALTGIVADFGAMARRTANGIVYDLLQGKGDFASYKMSDNKALFDQTNHSNLTSTGTALTSDSLSVGKALMRRQKDGKTALNIAPRHLICSPENEANALRLLNSMADVSAGNSNVTNIHRNTMDVIIDAELDALPWYLAAARKTIKTGTLAGTNGQPTVTQRMKSAGGVEYECLFDFGVVVEDYRGLYKNNGAN